MAAVARTSDALIGRFEDLGGKLPATFDSTWKPTVRYECLTGIAQLGGVWLRLYEVTGEARFRDAGLAERSSGRPATRNALHGGSSTGPFRVRIPIRSLRAASVPELGDEVPGRLSDAARAPDRLTVTGGSDPLTPTFGASTAFVSP